jgi:hypothetical protein
MRKDELAAHILYEAQSLSCRIGLLDGRVHSACGTVPPDITALLDDTHSRLQIMREEATLLLQMLNVHNEICPLSN